MRIATLFLLPKCDLACRFCGSELGFAALSEAEALQFVEFAAGHGYGSVVFGGGEPLLWRGDLLRLGARAREVGLVVQLNTNGVEWRDELESSPEIDRIILPLDGATAESHDYLRSPQGGHRSIIEDRLTRLCAIGKQVTIGSVICSFNRDELPLLSEELNRLVAGGLRLHAWHLYCFRAIGRGGAAKGRGSELGLDQQEFRMLCEPIQAEPRPWKVYRRPDMTRSRDVDFFWFEGGGWKASGFGAATQYIAGAGSLCGESSPLHLASAHRRPSDNE